MTLTREQEEAIWPKADNELLHEHFAALEKDKERYRLDAEKHYRAATECEQQLTAMTKERDEAIERHQASSDRQQQHYNELKAQLTAAQQSHAITQEGYSTLRANYDTLSRQYKELEQSIKVIQECGSDELLSRIAASGGPIGNKILVRHRELEQQVKEQQTALADSQQRVEELKDRCNIAACDVVAYADELLKTQTALTACREALKECAGYIIRLHSDEAHWDDDMPAKAQHVLAQATPEAPR